MAVMQLKDKNNKPLKTKDGRSWYFKVYYDDLNGNKKQYKSKKYLNKKDAQDAERTFLLSLTDKVDSRSMTIKDLIIDYKNHQKNKVKITTYTNYSKYDNKLKGLNNIKIIDFKINHFNQWKISFEKERYSTIYKNNVYKFLRAILNYGIKYYSFINLVEILNKMSGFTNPNELKKEMLFFTYDEFKKFINQENDLKYKTYFEMLYYCGLRKGEANALTWKDIDLENNVIDINKNVSLKIKGQQYTLIPPKTQSSYRLLKMPDILYNDIRSLKDYYKKYSNFSENWFVFGGSLPLADTTVNDKKNNNCDKANIKRIRIHDFRHSCASLLISNGASISLVSKYLGHSNLTTTLNTYTHMFKNEFNEIMEVINKL